MALIKRSLLFITLFMSLCFFSQANVTVSEAEIEEFHEQVRSIAQVFIAAQQESERESLSSVLNFASSLKSIYADIQHVRHTVANSSTETIHIMDLFDKIDTSPVCKGCERMVAIIKKLRDSKRIAELIENTAIRVCDVFANKTFCHDIVNTLGNIVLGLLAQKDHHICERIHLCPQTSHREKTKEYAEKILKDKPVTNIPTPSKKSTYTILQLADPHIDLDYDIGSNAFCDEPLCCRADFGTPSDPTKAAGYWGTKAHCDIPHRTFDQFLKFVAKNFNIDMIIWTGDNVSHDIWQQSAENQTVNTYDATQDILKYFPNTQVFPMFGNHESYPVDDFDLSSNSSTYILSKLADMWTVWLDEQALATFKNNTYYSMVDARFNVKVIALDTQACDTVNFYIIKNPVDPYGQLEWLRNELYDSESKNQSVIIMGHIPPGDNTCETQWSARYRALVDRFTNIIRGQYFGHTHSDEMSITRSYADESPVGIAYVAPAFTTFSFRNPSFRIFEVDTETNQPINYNQYRLDIEKANQNTTGDLEWDLVYNLKDEYNLTDLSFEAFDDLAERMKTDTSIVEKYVFNLNSGGTPVADLTKREIKHNYCSVKHSVYEDELKCLGLQTTVHDLMTFAAHLMPGAWWYDQC